MTKNENIDATFSIENEDLGNWVVSQIGIMDAFDKINMAVAEGRGELDKVASADGLSKHLS